MVPFCAPGETLHLAELDPGELRRRGNTHVDIQCTLEYATHACGLNVRASGVKGAGQGLFALKNFPVGLALFEVEFTKFNELDAFGWLRDQGFAVSSPGDDCRGVILHYKKWNLIDVSYSRPNRMPPWYYVNNGTARDANLHIKKIREDRYSVTVQWIAKRPINKSSELISKYN